MSENEILDKKVPTNQGHPVDTCPKCKKITMTVDVKSSGKVCELEGDDHWWVAGIGTCQACGFIDPSWSESGP